MTENARELLARLEQEAREAEIEAEVERRLAEREAEAAQAAQAAKARPRRSQMNARQKSDYIASRGLEKYQGLPW